MGRFARYATFLSLFVLVVACGRSSNTAPSDSLASESGFDIDSSKMNSGTNPRRSQTLRKPTHRFDNYGSAADWICGGLYDDEYWGLSSFCYATAALFDYRADVSWTMWLQLHNFPIETAPAANYMPPACLKFTVTLTEENGRALGLLRRVDADWNEMGARPTRARSGTNSSVLTLTYELKDSDTANLYIGSLVPAGKKSKLKIRYQTATCAGATAIPAAQLKDVTVSSSTLATRLNNHDGQIEYFPKDLSTIGSAEFYLIERPEQSWWFNQP